MLDINSKKKELALEITNFENLIVNSKEESSCVFLTIDDSNGKNFMTAEYTNIFNSIPTVVVNINDIIISEIAIEFAKKEKAKVLLNGREIFNFQPILKTESPEQIVKKNIHGNNKSNNSEIFTTQILEKVKQDLTKEIPEMIKGIEDYFKDNLNAELKKQLHKIVLSTVSTTSIILIRSLAKATSELKG